MARVLIVEDEGMLLDMMCTYMRSAGHEVSGSKSYDEALSLAYEKSFDLWIFDVKIIGGAYLIYLGYKGIRAKAKGEITEIRTAQAAPQSAKTALVKGFLCNVLNPKAPVYFVSIFTIVLSPAMPTWQLAVYGAWMMVLQFAWFALVTLLLSLPAINQRFQKAGHWIDRVLGVAMTALGIKVIIS